MSRVLCLLVVCLCVCTLVYEATAWPWSSGVNKHGNYYESYGDGSYAYWNRDGSSYFSGWGDGDD